MQRTLCLQRTKRDFVKRNVRFDISKAHIYKAQLADAQFDLSTGIHDMLRKEVELVIHNAWYINSTNPWNLLKE